MAKKSGTTMSVEDLRSMGFDENGKRLKLAGVPEYTPPAPPSSTRKPEAVAGMLYGLHDTHDEKGRAVFRPCFTVFIPGHVPSSKNNKMATVRTIQKAEKFGGKDVLVSKVVGGITHNERTKLYKKATESLYKEWAEPFKKALEGKMKPYRIQFLFVRKRQGRWDFHNVIQIPADLMVEHGWLEDDDIDTFLPVPPLTEPYYLVDKEAAGVFITIL